MFEKECRICGKSFQTKNKNAVCCSHECSIINQKLWAKQHPEYFKEYYPKRHTKIRVIKYCKICNEELPNAKQTYCLDCLLKKYMYEDKHKALHILGCRGYDKAMVHEELKQRGWI